MSMQTVHCLIQSDIHFCDVYDVYERKFGTSNTKERNNLRNNKITIKNVES